MDKKFKNQFLVKWENYFPGCELPVVFYYTDDPGEIARANIPDRHSCIVCELAIVRKGRPLAWNMQSLGCNGSKRYLGFTDSIRPGFEFFLSTGIPGEMEGERYVKTPEMVKEIMANMRCIPAKGKYIVFKRFDQLTPDEEPDAVIFFAKPDVLSGLYTLANYDQPGGQAVTAPFASGCGSIVHQPLLEAGSGNPRAVLGMFDPSARPCVPKDTLSFAIPVAKFKTMAGHMDECFLATSTWKAVRCRL